jgi:hypothetical protein
MNLLHLFGLGIGQAELFLHHFAGIALRVGGSLLLGRFPAFGAECRSGRTKGKKAKDEEELTRVFHEGVD